MKTIRCPHSVWSLHEYHRSQLRLFSLSAFVTGTTVYKFSLIVAASAFTTSVLYNHCNVRQQQQQQQQQIFEYNFKEKSSHYDQGKNFRTVRNFLLHSVRILPTTFCLHLQQQLDDVPNTVANTKSYTTKRTTDNDHQQIDDNKNQIQRFSVPEPTKRHVILAPPPPELLNQERSGILVVGDVHGCYDELMLLYEKAVLENNNKQFYYVILVGDLCNKGPQSMQVIRHIQRNEQYWKSIRGNHEHSVLNAYEELKKANSSPTSDVIKKYEWLLGEDNVESDGTTTSKLVFNDSDYEWMSNLPYTIRIPADHIGLCECGESNYKSDILIVHAALLPGIDVERNDVSTMVVLRDLPSNTEGVGDSNTVSATAKKVPWASKWNGPELIIFGHDAKRGLQQYKYAIGLDTGCVYGNQLSGIILPQRKLVQVNALKQHTPIIEK